MRSWSGIRFLSCALFALCAAGGFGASVMRQSSLPASGFADTEAVTNVVFSFAEDVARDFSVRLELDATPSNCVEVVFGCDADGDGRLGTAEAELSLGWDCGRWFVVGTNRLARIEAEPSVTVARRTLVLGMHVDAEVEVRRLSIRDGGAAELFPELASTRPGWLFNRRWNLARLAVRGIDPAHERALAVLCGVGTAVYLH